jgi:catechol 2,3-dioxygenase-like lactoylglutathione lyase family enzyme
MKLDHAGIVVPDLDAAVEWYTTHFGLQTAWREADTDVDDVAIGLPGERVRLRGAILFAEGAYLELHEYLLPVGTTSRRVCDLGIGHIAFFSDSILTDFERLKDAGVEFYSKPRLIDRGGLAGHWWVYGEDPWGNVIQLCSHPEPSLETGSGSATSDRA